MTEETRKELSYDEIYEKTYSIPTPWGMLGPMVLYRTYSRLRDPYDQTSIENYTEIIMRILRGCDEIGVPLSDDEKLEFAIKMKSLKCLPAGRFIWQMGTETVRRCGFLSLQNCAAVIADSPSIFGWVMDLSMLGCGVGVNIMKDHVDKIVEIKKLDRPIVREDVKDADYIIPDKREGWVKILNKILKAYFTTGKGFSFSAILLRGKGVPIKTFGGVSSGPEVLCDGLSNICNIFESRLAKGETKLHPIDTMDICCIIADIVVSGNVRRSSLMIMISHDDIETMQSKDWNRLARVPNWRSHANVSVVCSDVKELPEEFWNPFKEEGECFGLLNMNTSKLYGRCGNRREVRYDKEVIGYNPCGEQSLANKETCCLMEVFLCNIDTITEFKRCVYLLYKVAKHSLLLDCPYKDTNAIVHKNLRMGIGITGYQQATEEQKSWLPEVYDYLRNLDKEYSGEIGVPESIKLTTCKPSGTLSCLLGCTPGVHAGISTFFLRRVRLSADSPYVYTLRQLGYNVEPELKFDGSRSRTTVVADFPCRYPDGTKTENTLTAIEQLEDIIRVQSDWSDNSVSCTVKFNVEELPEIQEWLHENWYKMKSLSFILHRHGFPQAPFEEITEEKYNSLMAKCRPLSEEDIMHALKENSKIGGPLKLSDKHISDLECSGQSCGVR